MAAVMNSSKFMIHTDLNQSSGNKRPFSEISVKNLLEDGFDPEKNMSITFLKIGAGLENLGNTCFLNSVLQCLTYTEPLAAYLQHAGHLNHCQVSGFCALCAMQKHVRNALQANGSILAPIDLVLNLKCVSRNFKKCRQEDAHEFLISLLECMHRCSLPYGVSTESSDAYGSSSVHRIFGGSLRSQVKCEQCSYCSNKFDPFLDLSLEISRASSLQKALSRFTAAEFLDDGAKVYNCERCKQKVEAKKQLTIFKAPNVLTVHLKRFEAHLSEKINRRVQFPSTIDMKPFVSGPDEGNLMYTLYGVLVHYGKSIHSGHYACFVRTSSGIWYSLDDNTVDQVSEETVLDQRAYMLFYFRDKKKAAPKNEVVVVEKETSKESLATNEDPYVKDQVNESTVIKACGSDTPVANGSAPLKSCELGAPTVLSPKELTTKETQTNSPSSSIEMKENLKMENGSEPLKSCELGAPAVLSPKVLTIEETQTNSPSSSIEMKQILKMEKDSAPLKPCELGAPAVLSPKELTTEETQTNSPSSSIEMKQILKMENDSAPLKPCELGAPAVLSPKELTTEETQTNSPSRSIEMKQILKMENDSATLKPCELAAPAVLSPKELTTEETQTNSPSSSVEMKQILKMEDDSAPLKPCDLAAPVVLTQKDLVTKGPLLQSSGEGSMLRVDSEAACAILPGNVSPVLDGSTYAQTLVNLPTSGSSPIDEAVLIDQTLGPHREESNTTTSTSDRESLTTPTKTRKRKLKALQMGISSFKLSLSFHKKKKQKRERLSTLAVGYNSEKLLSKKRTRDQELSTSKIAPSACLLGKDNNVNVHSNGNMLFGSPVGDLRTNQNGAVLASDQHQSLENSELSEATTKRKRESSKEEQILLQKQSMNILTRGLPEAVFAKWYGDVSASEKTRSKTESRGIRYVADELDEAYERGKQKKMKMKEESYKGSNPFQLLAPTNRLTKPEKNWTQRQKHH